MTLKKLEEPETDDVVYATSIRTLARWSPPSEQANGLVVEVGVQGPDVIFHFWNSSFPDGFDEGLFDAVDRVIGAPERFQAVFTPEIMAIWDPGMRQLHIGEAHKIKALATAGSQRRVVSWAMRAIGFAPIKEAHTKLTNDLVAAIEELF